MGGGVIFVVMLSGGVMCFGGCLVVLGGFLVCFLCHGACFLSGPFGPHTTDVVVRGVPLFVSEEHGRHYATCLGAVQRARVAWACDPESR